jgi:hypothetical protein
LPSALRALQQQTTNKKKEVKSRQFPVGSKLCSLLFALRNNNKFDYEKKYNFETKKYD